jgi:hypothetical protein
MEELPRITQQRKWRLWFSACAAAAVAMTIGAPEGWAMFWAFPVCAPPVIVAGFLLSHSGSSLVQYFMLPVDYIPHATQDVACISAQPV